MLLQLKKFEFLKFLLILHTKFDIPLLIFQISLPRVRNIRGLNALYYGIFFPFFFLLLFICTIIPFIFTLVAWLSN